MTAFFKKLFCLSLLGISACASQGLEPAAELPRTAERPAAANPAENNTWWHPSVGTTWQIQLSGAIDTSIDAQVYDIDLFDADAKTIEQLHAQGRKVICYFSAGSFEDWRPDAANFPAEVLGKDYENWPGERWLDIRQIEKLAPVMRARMDLAAQKNCDGVDPDNVNAYDIDSGFPLSGENQLAFNRWLAAEAHGRGLAIGLKNDLSQISELVGDFDFAINESCFAEAECDELKIFIQANKPVWGIEYQGSTEQFCPQARKNKFNTLKKALDLGPARESCD